MTSPALYDTLFLADRLASTYGETTLGELILLSYFGLILFRYGGGLTSEWGYEFNSTETGTPFSVELLRASEEGRSSGLLAPGRQLTLTALGEEWLQAFESFSIYADRRLSLEAATDIALFIPSGSLRLLLEQEPSLAASRSEGSPRRIPDPASETILNAQFRRVLLSIGELGAPRLVAAATWLKSLDILGDQPL